VNGPGWGAATWVAIACPRISSPIALAEAATILDKVGNLESRVRSTAPNPLNSRTNRQRVAGGGTPSVPLQMQNINEK
jgi:hypothetical protein